MLQPLQSGDLWLFELVTPWHAGWLDLMMSSISLSGTGSAFWIVLAFVGMLRRSSRMAAWRVYLVILLCYGMVDGVLKPAIARPRPISVRAFDPPRSLPPMPRSLSFPSGHSAAAFGSAAAISRMWPQGRVLWWTLAVLMGYSRIYVGHHYPLDVAGGALVGVLIAMWVLGGRPIPRKGDVILKVSPFHGSAR
jgi:undecaprenyl-diphosphatase